MAVPGDRTDDLVRDMIEVPTSIRTRLFWRRSAHDQVMRAVTAAKRELGVGA